MTISLKVGLVVGAVLLSGGRCLSAELQLRSLPEGALIVENETGKRYRSPINLAYALENNVRDQSGCYIVKGFTAIWESGARADTPTTISLCGAGPIWNYRFNRPHSAPGAGIDYAFESRLNQKAQSSDLAGYLIGSFLRGYLGGGARSYSSAGSGGIHTYETPPAPVSSGPQLAPDGSFVSGNGPVTLCPDGSFVAGQCTLAPNGKFVGQ